MFGLAPRPRGGARSQSRLQPPTAGKDGDSLAIGRRVRTHPKGMLGIVRFMGQTHFADGVWVGLELDTSDGRNDGEVQGQRYFSCSPAHGVFVRPENCVVIKGAGSTVSNPVQDRRPRTSIERSHSTRRGQMASDNFGYTGIPTASSSGLPGRDNGVSSSAWGAGSDAGSARRDIGRRPEGGSVIDRRNAGLNDDQIIGRLLASEGFSRVLSAKVADGIRIELANRDADMKLEHEAVMERLCEVENLVEEACGAMDDIAGMVQTISDQVNEAHAALDSNASTAETDGSLSDNEGEAAGGVAGGGGGRDDARVAELTKLLCTVHNMSSQAAQLLRNERNENIARIRLLTQRVHDLEDRQMDATGTENSEPSEG